MQPPPDESMTSADVARFLGVAGTSVKRWADAGVLPCARTPGNHRRFAREDVERFRRLQHAAGARNAPELDEWIRLLRSDCGPYEIQSALLFDRSRHGAWWRVGEVVGALLQRIGELWERGELSVLEEHAMTERLARALARCSEAVAVATDAPRALLATAEGEDHTLALSLVELALREAGYATTWGGRATPTSEIVALVRQRRVRLLAISASRCSSDAGALAAQARTLAEACAASGTVLVLGGNGAWPARESGGPAFERVRDFGEFDRLLSGLRA